MPKLSVNFEQPRRLANVKINKWHAQRLGIEAGVVPCYVLGLFQCAEEDNTAYPVFVCELMDGRVIEVVTEAVQFVDINMER